MDLMADWLKQEEDCIPPEREEVSPSLPAPQILILDDAVALKSEVGEARLSIAVERSEIDVELDRTPQLLDQVLEPSTSSGLPQHTARHMEREGVMMRTKEKGTVMSKTSSSKGHKKAQKRKRSEASNDYTIIRKSSRISSNCRKVTMPSSTTSSGAQPQEEMAIAKLSAEVSALDRKTSDFPKILEASIARHAKDVQQKIDELKVLLQNQNRMAPATTHDVRNSAVDAFLSSPDSGPAGASLGDGDFHTLFPPARGIWASAAAKTSAGPGDGIPKKAATTPSVTHSSSGTPIEDIPSSATSVDDIASSSSTPLYDFPTAVVDEATLKTILQNIDAQEFLPRDDEFPDLTKLGRLLPWSDSKDNDNPFPYGEPALTDFPLYRGKPEQLFTPAMVKMAIAATAQNKILQFPSKPVFFNLVSSRMGQWLRCIKYNPTKKGVLQVRMRRPDLKYLDDAEIFLHFQSNVVAQAMSLAYNLVECKPGERNPVSHQVDVYHEYIRQLDRNIRSAVYRRMKVASTDPPRKRVGRPKK